MPERTMQQWFDAYAESHQNPLNKSIHWVCVPTIYWCLLGLLSLIPAPAVITDSVPGFHFGWLLVLLGLIFFFRLSAVVAFGMGAVSVLLLWLTHLVNSELPLRSGWVYFGLFVLAWIGQFYGHKVEGKKPSFFMDLQFLLIGPAWLLSFILKRLNISY